MKAKPIYAVHCTTKLGFGLQPVKANNKVEARKKFRKRFPKSRVLDIDRVPKDHAEYNRYKNSTYTL